MTLGCKVQGARRKVKVQSVKFLFFNLGLCALSFTLSAGCQQQRLYKDNRVMMGTFVEVVSPSKEAGSIVFEEFKRIEHLLSKYDPGSEIAILNKTGRIKASPDTFFIVQKSVDFWKKSGGAFDITVAPLVDLWGFTDKHFRVPETREIIHSLERVGSDKIVLYNNDNVIEFKIPGMKIDLGGIAKGYALDCAVKRLKERGILSCLINAGGQVYCLGRKFNEPWRVAIKAPRGRQLTEYLDLMDQSVATSGNYEQFFFHNQKRYAHIIHPKTGYPVENGFYSVTVVASDGLTADALSTAVFVLGKEEGLRLQESFSGVKIMIDE